MNLLDATIERLEKMYARSAYADVGSSLKDLREVRETVGMVEALLNLADREGKLVGPGGEALQQLRELLGTEPRG